MQTRNFIAVGLLLAAMLVSLAWVSLSGAISAPFAGDSPQAASISNAGQLPSGELPPTYSDPEPSYSPSPCGSN